jgi:hypothetical protein
VDPLKEASCNVEVGEAPHLKIFYKLKPKSKRQKKGSFIYRALDRNLFVGCHKADMLVLGNIDVTVKDIATCATAIVKVQRRMLH